MSTTEILLPEASTGDRRAAAEDVVCLGCGCLCDDIKVLTLGGRIIEARRSCGIGDRWFRADRGDSPSATIDGAAVDSDAAIDRAARILGSVRRPVVLGLTGCSIEAQGAAVAIADRIGAAMEAGIGRDQTPTVRAFQRVGRASATLGEIRNRADLVVFWGVDPVETHPRHLERYSADPVGRFLPGGRADRTLVVFDGNRTATAEAADLFLRIDPDRQLETLWNLRAIVNDVRNLPSAPDPALLDLAERFVRARYAAIFFGSNLGRGSGGSARVEALFGLVRDLNARTRCVAMSLGGPGNGSGGSAVLAWRTGLASPVDFRRVSPSSIPGEADVEALLARGEADAALIVADDPRRWLSPGAIEHLGRIPVVAIGSEATWPDRASAVAIASSRFGIESGGTTLRSDGIMLPIRPPLASDLPSETEILDAIASRLPTRGDAAS